MSSKTREILRWMLAATPLVAVLALAPRWMNAAPVPNTFSDGAVASATAVNANFASLAADIDTLATGVGFTTIASYDSSGSFVVPAGVKRVWVKVWGGGGGGGGASSSWSGCGGGGGGYAEGIYAVTAGATITVTVGAVGAAGPAGADPASNGGTGGTSSFGAFLSATGGGGGPGSGSCNIGGLGGVGTGQVTVRGQAGKEAFYGANLNYMQGGDGGSAPNGGGGGSGSNVGATAVAMAGAAPGGGGAGGGRSGAAFLGGSPGAAGRVTVYY